jgi:carbon-monoxide dehydrogenase large subunit
VTNITGQRVRRREDPRFLTGRACFVDDMRAPDALWVTFVRSDVAHGRLLSIDSSEAAGRPGARVFTAADLGLGNFPVPPVWGIDPQMHRPLIAADTVRFAGEVIAAVVSETREGAVDAEELVFAEIEPLPAVTDAAEALRDEVLLFPGTGSNTCVHRPPQDPDEHLFDDCEVVTSGVFHSQRLAACPLEPRSTLARMGEDGRLSVWLSTQTPHRDRDGIAMALGLAPEQVRVIAPDVGGGFGGKGLDVEDVLVAALAQATGRPVRWTETRTEHLVAMHHGRAQRLEFTIGGSRDGRVQALRLSILQDLGAYPGLGVFLPVFTAMMSSGVYAIPRIETEIRGVVTNTTQIAAVRGAGRPEATQVLERAMDLFAAAVELDPAEMRRRNLIPADAFPCTTASGAAYDSGDYAGALDRALERAGYDELRAEQARRRRLGEARQLGIGVSAYVEVTNGVRESEFGAVEVTAEGGAVLRTGSFSHGQGHETTFAQIVADRLGLPFEKVVVLKGDTDTVMRGSGTYGSKSTQIGGAAAHQASDEVVERARRLVAEELEANAQDIVLDRDEGRFHVAGAPQAAVTWAELATRLEARGELSALSAESDFDPGRPTFPFGAHLALVEVDVETGAVELLRLVAVDDAGRIINPLVAEGQVHGGLAAGIAQALYEELTYDEIGNPVNANLVTYGFPGPVEFPMFETVEMETPTPVNPLGAKGIGESGTIGATPAVQSAVIDAVSHLGVRHIDMPVNGERVWQAVQEARGAGSPAEPVEAPQQS